MERRCSAEKHGVTYCEDCRDRLCEETKYKATFKLPMAGDMLEEKAPMYTWAKTEKAAMNNIRYRMNKQYGAGTFNLARDFAIEIDLGTENKNNKENGGFEMKNNTNGGIKMNQDLNKLTVVQLKVMLAAEGITSYSNKKKQELINMVEAAKGVTKPAGTKTIAEPILLTANQKVALTIKLQELAVAKKYHNIVSFWDIENAVSNLAYGVDAYDDEGNAVITIDKIARISTVIQDLVTKECLLKINSASQVGSQLVGSQLKVAPKIMNWAPKTKEEVMKQEVKKEEVKKEDTKVNRKYNYVEIAASLMRAIRASRNTGSFTYKQGTMLYYAADAIGTVKEDGVFMLPDKAYSNGRTMFVCNKYGVLEFVKVVDEKVSAIWKKGDKPFQLKTNTPVVEKKERDYEEMFDWKDLVTKIGNATIPGKIIIYKNTDGYLHGTAITKFKGEEAKLTYHWNPSNPKYKNSPQVLVNGKKVIDKAEVVSLQALIVGLVAAYRELLIANKKAAEVKPEPKPEPKIEDKMAVTHDGEGIKVDNIDLSNFYGDVQ